MADSVYSSERKCLEKTWIFPKLWSDFHSVIITDRAAKRIKMSLKLQYGQRQYSNCKDRNMYYYYLGTNTENVGAKDLLEVFIFGETHK